jgi:hypothetical protein
VDAIIILEAGFPWAWFYFLGKNVTVDIIIMPSGVALYVAFFPSVKHSHRSRTSVLPWIPVQECLVRGRRRQDSRKT